MTSFKLDHKKLPELAVSDARALDAMSDIDILAAARSDSDNLPLTLAELARLRDARKAKRAGKRSA